MTYFVSAKWKVTQTRNHQKKRFRCLDIDHFLGVELKANGNFALPDFAQHFSVVRHCSVLLFTEHFHRDPIFCNNFNILTVLGKVYSLSRSSFLNRLFSFRLLEIDFLLSQKLCRLLYRWMIKEILIKMILD